MDILQRFDYERHLTPSLPGVSNLNWSPASHSVSFLSGSDIYVVETKRWNKKPCEGCTSLISRSTSTFARLCYSN